MPFRTSPARVVPPVLSIVVVAIAAGVGAAPVPAADDVASSFKAMTYRSIGPYRGGRSTAVSGVPGQPETFYMGSTGGGVWKTTDFGLTWTNVSDKQFKSASVGAVAVAPSDPNVVYAGMGSACIRGNTSPGDGVYRSTDAGKSWKRVEFEEGGQVGSIVVHPTNADLVYVAVLGHAFGANEARGVFRSRDGGEKWERVLYVSDRAGAVDLALDPNNPRILFAAMWQAIRQPWALISGGEDSGLYRSTDGGDTWTELTAGLPEGIKGKIGVTVSSAKPGRVWTLVEAEDGGIFRSDDGGDTFRLVNDDRNFRQRAWYYMHIFADPVTPDTVYVLNVGMYRSTDGGKSFSVIHGPHGDHHALWINPRRPEIMINGNDGGATVTVNGGATWSTQANQPTAEFYRVTVDDAFPYRVYGAQQDNTTVSIASRTSSSGITQHDWHPVGGGESGHIAVDPENPGIVYAGSYGGEITRYDHATGQTRNILAYPQLQLGQAPRELTYRFQWNAPIRLSPHDSKVLYHTSNVVHRSTDEGQTWERISPDLTRGDPEKLGASGGPITLDNTGVEVYATIFAFEESPREAGVLWAGSDDGLVHLSRDGGKSWTDVTPNRMPEWGQVNMIEVSPAATGRAFLAVTRYKLDDFKPYIFRTDDYGKSWTLLTDGRNGIPADHFVRVVREDPDRKELLYAGTEFGIYVSFDDGKHWQSLQLDLPVTPVTDMVVKERDLVVATQGRALWILDDLTPLQQFDSRDTERGAHLYEPRRCYRGESGGNSEDASRPAGKNPPAGAVIYYRLSEAPKDEVVLEILDAGGKVVRSLSNQKEEPRAPDPLAPFRTEPRKPVKLTADPGLNRFVWDLRYPDAKIVETAVLWGGPRGPEAVPGSYTVRLSVGDEVQTRSLEVVPDPRLEATQADFESQFEIAMDLYDMLNAAHGAVRTIRDVRGQVTAIAGRMQAAGLGDVQDAARDLDDQLTAIEERLHQTRAKGVQDPLNFPPKLDAQILYLYDVVGSADAKPTAGAVSRHEELKRELDAVLVELQGVLDDQLAAFDAAVRRHDVPPVVVPR